MARKPHSMLKVVQNLGWPIFWGLSAFIGLLLCFQQGVITNELIIRYATAHPVSYCVTLMFCIGTASLLLKSSGVFQQFTNLDRITLQDELEYDSQSPRTRENEESQSIIERAGSFISRLELMPIGDRQSYLWQRLRDTLDCIRRGGINADPDEELKYLSDMDAAKQQDGFALVRILIWATPMLGFLGTVIGISEALGGLSVGEEQNFGQMMTGLRESLYVAFDTTALALTLSIVLMFCQFLVDRFETQLLSAVDHRSAEQINRHFQFTTEEVASRDPYLESVKRMSLMVLQSIEQTSEKQSETWKQGVGDSVERMQTGLSNSNAAVADTISQAVKGSLEVFAEKLQGTMEESDSRINSRWEKWQVAMSENSRVMQRQQEELVRQAELLEQAIRSSGDVMQIQDALNENLNTLSRSDSFEQMIASLSAAVNLLSVKLDSTGPANTGRHERSRTQSRRAA